MVNFAAIITLLVSITTFFTDNLPGAGVFTSWSQKLLAAPTQIHFESVTIITPVTFTTTFTTTIPTFTSTVAPPGNELLIVKNTLPSGNISFFAALKEIICVLYALLRLPSDAATLVSAFFFATLLLALIICFFASSSPASKPEDLIYLEAQVNQKDELLQKLRTSYAADRADFLRRLQVQRDEADERLSDASAQHSSALATKDQEIRELRSDLAFADLREEGARLKASDEVIKLRKEIGHLQCKLDSLERELDAQEELVAGAEEAQEKVKVAEERALAAAQEALEANQKVEAAKKAHKEYLVGERACGQAAVDKVKAEVKEVMALKRVEEYKVQDRDQELKALKKELEKLKAGVAVGVAASVPTPPIIQSLSSKSKADKIRKDLRDVPVALGAVSMPASAPTVAGAPAAPAPRPSSPAKKTSLGPRPQPKGPFAPKQWGVNSKRGA
ncbi:hypothetical protein KCU92_g5196, partial [Aureobasidium melanogenum]|jgi:hypothetical protein